VVSKAGKLSGPKKFLVIIDMPTLKTPKDIQVFNGMAQYYMYFIKDFAFIMAPITKLFVEDKSFRMDGRMLISLGRNQTMCYMDAPIFISFHWDIKFHVHTYICNLVIEVMLA
jgi:hypothetical protein